MQLEDVAAFPGSSACTTAYYGNDLPAFGSGAAGASAGHVLVNSRPHDYVTRCDAKGIKLSCAHAWNKNSLECELTLLLTHGKLVWLPLRVFFFF